MWRVPLQLAGHILLSARATVAFAESGLSQSEDRDRSQRISNLLPVESLRFGWSSKGGLSAIRLLAIRTYIQSTPTCTESSFVFRISRQVTCFRSRCILATATEHRHICEGLAAEQVSKCHHFDLQQVYLSTCLSSKKRLAISPGRVKWAHEWGGPGLSGLRRKRRMPYYPCHPMGIMPSWSTMTK